MFSPDIQFVERHDESNVTDRAVRLDPEFLIISDKTTNEISFSILDI